MRRMLPTEAAVLAHLEPLSRFLPVLGRAVVAPFALLARQGDDVSHLLTLAGPHPRSPTRSHRCARAFPEQNVNPGLTPARRRARTAALACFLEQSVNAGPPPASSRLRKNPAT